MGEERTISVRLPIVTWAVGLHLGLTEDPSFRITPGERIVDCEVFGEFHVLPQCTIIPHKLPVCIQFVILVHVLLLNLGTWKPHTLEAATLYMMGGR